MFFRMFPLTCSLLECNVFGVEAALASVALQATYRIGIQGQ